MGPFPFSLSLPLWASFHETTAVAEAMAAAEPQPQTSTRSPTEWLASRADTHFRFLTRAGVTKNTVDGLVALHPQLGDGWAVQKLKNTAEHALLPKCDLLSDGKPGHPFSKADVDALVKGKTQAVKAQADRVKALVRRTVERKDMERKSAEALAKEAEALGKKRAAEFGTDHFEERTRKRTARSMSPPPPCPLDAAPQYRFDSPASVAPESPAEMASVSQPVSPKEDPAEQPELYARTKKKHNMCKDCGSVRSSYGLASEQKKNWCMPCAVKNHQGAVRILGRGDTCEDCLASGKEKMSRPTFGMPGERKKYRWCKQCASSHPGCVDPRSK